MDSSIIDHNMKLATIYKLYNTVNDWVSIEYTILPITDVIDNITLTYHSKHPSSFNTYMREIGLENWRIKILDVKFIESIYELDALKEECIR